MLQDAYRKHSKKTVHRDLSIKRSWVGRAVRFCGTCFQVIVAGDAQLGAARLISTADIPRPCWFLVRTYLLLLPYPLSRLDGFVLEISTTQTAVGAN